VSKSDSQILKIGIMASVPTKLATGKHTATLIFCHGLGDTGHGWCSQIHEVCSKSLSYLKIVCPNAPIQPVTLNFGMKMPSWFDIKALTFDAPEDEPGITNSSDLLKQMIEDEIKAGISPSRIVVGGFSQGGAVALHTLVTYDKKLAGCIGLSTFLPLHKKFPGICKEENKDTKIFLGHGTADPVVSFKFGESTKTVMDKYYGNVKFHSYSGMPHSSCPKEMKDVLEYLKNVIPKTS